MAGTGVELLFGPLFIGVILSTAVYGIMSVQMLRYYQTYKDDPRCFRYFILYLFFAETANLLIQIGIIYEPLIVRYGTQRALITSPLHAISIVAVSTAVQLFTAWRIYVITESITLLMLISILSVASFGGGLLVTVFTAIRNEFREFQSFAGAVIVWLICSAVCDVLITVVLTYSLSTRKTGSTAVDGQINRIIRLTVQTGAITTVAALADLIIFLVFPTTTLNFIPDFPLSKLYTISLLSSFNARHRERSGDTEQQLPNTLFNESTIQKSTVNTIRNLVLCPTSQDMMNSDQSSNATLIAQGGRSFVKDDPDVPPKDIQYPPDSRADTGYTPSSRSPPVRF
ncbi:hypothetical protein MVEN_01445800 [Mycena venus]|uniref:DUF6534 domain-containing protein n=1 Tax=Mycena venus TaxID=2733690 RepID=A0A8H6XUG7_9AGAR|nr:hypothetical protein MVEN_01445800 [Mycena venus]